MAGDSRFSTHPLPDLPEGLPVTVSAASSVSCEDSARTNQPSQPIDVKLREQAAGDVRDWQLSARRGRCRVLEARLGEAARVVETTLAELHKRHGSEGALHGDAKQLVENGRLLRGVTVEARRSVRAARRLPQIQPQRHEPKVPRCYAAASAFLRAVGLEFDEDAFAVYLQAVQEHQAFEINELWALKSMMQLFLLEQIGQAAPRALPASENGESSAKRAEPRAETKLTKLIISVRKINDAEWKDLFERLSTTDSILRQDPAGAYSQMDPESRETYRRTVQELAFHSEADEATVAQQAIDLARKAQTVSPSSPRVIARRGHVGYYLIDRGRETLEKEINFRPRLAKQAKNLILELPEFTYFLGLELLIFFSIAFALSGLRGRVPLWLAVLFFVLPASESAVGMMNRLLAFILPPRSLPKLDFSPGIPGDCVTMVGIPTLLISEEQVRQLVRDLEVRYLGNRDPNLHFALLTDPPDSPEPLNESDKLVDLCSRLIRDLNDQYRGERGGSFFHFHRRQVYNPSEGAWMGWERKRGKLLDFNNLLLGTSDSFPVKTGDLSLLPSVRYVITLDSDTQLPRDSAHRLIGALAHPLNRAVIDPATNTVVEGYGILQPRVGISVRSATRSRLANIYSGHTGFDLYTRAISNVYQDVFGEGIFAGKGIYEVEVFHKVLADRFPHNTILSHDLIEGAYARAGLLSDIEIIDDYPSHFSAYSRRKHRWVRGDWQIMRWLFPRVPSASGKMVPNPLSLISRWKILDNLRRSVTEIAIFVLLLAAWFFLPGSAGRWTRTILVLLLLPTYLELILAMVKLPSEEDPLGRVREAIEAFIAGQVNVLLLFVFLAHQALVTLDAVVRTLVRLTVTHRKLLEWETASQAELQTRRRTPVDIYLDCTPYLSVGLGGALSAWRPHALPAAIPVLALWVCSKPLAHRLNRPLRLGRNAIRPQDGIFLRKIALRTWRFFRTFRSQLDNWLIPDHVQEDPPLVFHSVSPTNLGLLLNAQLAAYVLGFVTLVEFAEETEPSLETMKGLAQWNGHFFNWYDTRTLAALPPFFVSAVDNGNLACCLWTLRQGFLSSIESRLFRPALFWAVHDHLRLASEALTGAQPRNDLAADLEAVSAQLQAFGDDAGVWMRALPDVERRLSSLAEALTQARCQTVVAPASSRQLFPDAAEMAAPPQEPGLGEVQWWVAETRTRIGQLRKLAERLTPWILPEFAELTALPTLRSERACVRALTLEALPAHLADLDGKLEAILGSGKETPEIRSAAHTLRSRLPACLAQAEDLRTRLRRLAEEARHLVQHMDFRLLYHPGRRVLSLGYEGAKHHLAETCYDLLASEARTAVFVAIAKGDIPQESWFYLGRAHTRCRGRLALLSWSGTMFEYLMPALWMRNYPTTVLEQSARAVVACQQEVGRRLKVPWGISESACAQKDEDGHYQYRAFGLRALALKPDLPGDVVVSPYSTCLALAVDPAGSVENLRRMAGAGWLGPFGFYEAVQLRHSVAPAFRACPECNEALALATGSAPSRFEVVRSWMAHHQGMILLAITNVLSNFVMQRLFHEEPMVMATERILHEKLPIAIHIERRDPRDWEQFERQD
jgi:cyclic beta-1,2-glucan synthetase